MPIFNLANSLSGHPISSCQAKESAVHARQIVRILQRCFGDPALVELQRSVLIVERCVDLQQLVCCGIVDEFRVFGYDVGRCCFRQREFIDVGQVPPRFRLLLLSIR